MNKLNVSRFRVAFALLLILSLPAGGAVMVESASNIEVRNKAIVQKVFDAWSAGTGSPFELLAENATWTVVGHSLVAKTYDSRDAFLKEVMQPFNARMRESLKPSVRQISADGDRVIILFDARAVARDGKPYANTYAWFFRMRDGKVVDATAFFDSIVFNDLWLRVPAGP
jgi:ketosteroid isomerase-like protein